MAEEVTITANDADAAEPGDDGQFTVTLTSASADDTVISYLVTGTAAPGSDFTPLSGSATILATETTATIDVGILDGSVLEDDETVTVTLDAITEGDADITIGAADSDTVTIADDDSAEVSIAANDPSATEPSDDGQFTVTLTNASDTDTVISYTVTGTAAPGGDFNPLSGSVTILATETTATINVMVLDGSVVENSETVTVTLDAISQGDADITIGAADSDTVTIADNNSATLSIGDVTLVEGDNGTTQLVFDVTLDKAVDTGLTVAFATADDTAEAGSDYTAANGTLSFAGSAGEVQTVTVDIIGDMDVELDETFFVDLSNVQASGRDVTIANGQGLGTIENDDTGLSIAGTDATKDEGNDATTPFTFTVTRSGVLSGTTTVDYFVDHVHGLAQAHEPDFEDSTLPSGQLTFNPGQATKTITVDVVGETLGEVDEGFTIRLANPSSGVTLIQDTANGIIQNDDAPTMSIFAVDADLDEGNSGTTQFTFAVTRSGELSGVTSSVDFDVIATPGTGMADLDDFGGTLPGGTVTFDASGPGETLQTITIDVTGDIARELSEQFSVTLSSPSGGTIGIGAATGTIRDDDSLSSINLGDFSDVSDLTLNGDAAQTGAVLRLTPNAQLQNGSAFFNLPASVGNETSLATEFRFQMSGAANRADGFTFIIQNDPSGSNALGDHGSALGYDDLFGGDSIENSVAIEFDTYKSGAYDPNDNHIAVLTNGVVTTNPPLAVATPSFDLNDGGVYKAWIDYNLAGTDLLEIYIDDSAGGFVKPDTPILTHAIQLDSILNGNDAYVGFTAATGGFKEAHDILDWTLEIDPGSNLTYRADASAFEVTGGSSSTGTANAGFVLSADKAMLDYAIDFSALNLKENVGDRTGDLDVTRITLRVGAAGSDETSDPVVLTILDGAVTEDDFNPDWDRDILSGSWDSDDSSLLADYADELAAGELYVFVETFNPANNIRGQISSSVLTFDGVADPGEIVPNGGSIPQPDLTNLATALVSINMNAAGTEIEYFIDIDGLTLPEDRVADEDREIWGIHLHRGGPGANGSHALNIFGTPMKGGMLAEDDDDLYIDYERGVVRGTWGDPGDNTLGGMMGSESLQNVLDELLASDIYVQIHAIDEFGDDTRNIRAQVALSDNIRPNAPIITEPPAPGTESHFTDVHMEAPFFIDPDGNEHLYTDFEIWTVDGSEMVWNGRTTGDFEKVHAHFADGEFVGPALGDTQLQPDTDYVLRVRYIDDQGAFSEYSETPFFTSPANAIVPMTTEDILVTPNPTWEESGTGDRALDPGQFIELRAEDDSLLLRFDHTGVTNDTGPLETDQATKVVANLNGESASNFTFETVETGEQTISLPSNADGTFWVSTSGTTYNDQALSDVAQGTLQPYRAVQEGYEVEVAHHPSAGLQIPVNIAFVPDEVYDTYITDPNDPGYDGSKPLYYVSELFGTIKEVTLDGTMHEYVPDTLPGAGDFTSDNDSEVRVKGLLNYAPGDSISGASEQGVGGLTVVENDDGGLDVYVGYLYSESGTQYARLVKLTDTDGDHEVDVEDTIIDFGPTRGRAGEDTVTGEETLREWNNPAEQGQSHFISKVSIQNDEIYLHMGDGFNASTAQQKDQFLGKILRLDLDGMPVTTNAFYNDTPDFDDDGDGAFDTISVDYNGDGELDLAREEAVDDDPDNDGIDAADYIWAIGYRNPFGGDWREADQSLYVVENGQSINDRLSKSESGVNYGWTGNFGFFGDQDSMTTNAIYNWVPTVAPVDLAFIQDGTYGGSSFPVEMWDIAFATLSGPTFADGVPVYGETGGHRGKQIVYFDIEDAVGGVTPLVPDVEGGPNVLVNYVGVGRGSFSGIASGPDGLYFLSLYDDLNKSTGDTNNNPIEVGAQVFRVRYETLEIAVDDADHAEDAMTPFTFTVTRDGDLTRETTVEYQVLGGATNAADASDFGGTFPTGIVTFGFGEDTQTILIDVQPDTANETDESFVVHLFGASSGTITDGDASGVIRNDDTPRLSIAALDAVKDEGSGGTTPFTFEVTRTGDPTLALTVTWEVVLSGTASAADFDGPLSGTIDSWADQTPRTIVVNVAADSIVEFDEDFSLELITAPGASIVQPSAGATIQDDDAATLSIADVTHVEGDGGVTQFVFNVTLDEDVDGGFSVAFSTADDTAEAGSDYTATSGTLNFAGTAGEVETVIVDVIGDTEVDPNEAFFVNLSNIQAGGLDVTLADAQAVGTITNDDTATLSITDVTLVEGDAGTSQFVFEVTLDQAVDGGVTVSFDTAEDTAEASSDYTSASGTLNFAGTHGEVQTITVDVSGDTDVEPDETFFVNLSNVQAGGLDVTIADGQGLGTITNDDGSGGGTTISFGPDTVSFDHLWNEAGLITANGDASASAADRLSLTANAQNQAGSAFYSEALAINDGTSFQTEFTFQLGGGTGGADGFVFMLQGEGLNAVGDRGSALGYDDLSGGNAINNSLAVEFDNFDFGSWDPNRNHVSVLLDGDVTNAVATQATLPTGVDLNNGDDYRAWVEYDGSTNDLSVFIANLDLGQTKTELLTVNVGDLDGILGDVAYAGFSGGTGGLANSHDILDWTLSVDGGTALAAPTVTGITDDTGTPGDGVTSDNTLIIDGTAEANVDVEVFLGVTSLGTTTADGAGDWSFDYTAPPLADGDYQITAQAIDGGGGSSPLSTAFDLTVDTTVPSAPAVTGVTEDTGTPGDGVTSDNTLIIDGTAEANATVEVFLGVASLGTTVADGAGDWSFDYTGTVLADGDYQITARATDAAGNLSGPSAAFDLTVDTTGGGTSISFGPDTVSFDHLWNEAGLIAANGDASASAADRLSLTANAQSQAGSAFYSEALGINDGTSFQTEFTFQLGGGTGGADGFVFMLQGEGLNALGDRGSALGYDDLSGGNAINNSLAVEFDNFDFGSWDPNRNHISVLLDGDVTNAVATQAALPTGVDLNNGDDYRAWVEYDGSTNNLSVFIANLDLGQTKTELLTVNVGDLDGILGDVAYAGFSGGTGGLTNGHDILDWEMSILV